MNIHQKERIFFFTHAITILSLFTYSVCDEKVKKWNIVEKSSVSSKMQDDTVSLTKHVACD